MSGGKQDIPGFQSQNYPREDTCGKDIQTTRKLLAD